MRHFYLAATVLSFGIMPIYAFKLLSGSNVRMTTNFPIGVHAFSYGGGRMLIGSAVPIEDEASKRFSIAMSDHGNTFEPLMLPTIILNNSIEQQNPAYGQSIGLLHAAQRERPLPIFTIANDRQTLYMFESMLTLTIDKVIVNYPILIAKKVPDANGNSGDIHAIASAQVGDRFLIFVAVSPAGQSFGVQGSGIAILELITWQQPTLWPKVENNTIINAPQPDIRHVSLVVRHLLKSKVDQKKRTSSSQDTVPQGPAKEDTDDMQAWLFDQAHPLALKESPAPMIANTVELYWDPTVNRLYIGLQGTSADDSNALFCGLMVAQLLKDNQTPHLALSFTPIVPVNAITEAGNIVATKGANKAVSIYKLATLSTSTGLNYIVVAGGNDVITKVGNRIWALPIINDGKSGILNGTLADVSSLPETRFGHTYPFSFVHRGMVVDKDAQDKPRAVFTDQDSAAQVGNGPLPLAPDERITELFTHGDAVYATIGNEYSATTKPGMFVSQALFDAHGRIMAWTAWKRASGTTLPMFGASIDSATGDTWILGGASCMSVGYTQWSRGDRDFLLGGTDDPQVGFVSLVNHHFPSNEGGVLAIHDFDSDTPGFGNNGAQLLNQLALQIITGNKKIMLVETARNERPHACNANNGDFATGLQSCDDGTLKNFKQNNDTKVLVLSGGVLEQLGPISCAQLSRMPLTDGTANGLLFVGGVNGVAVLSRSDGSGWNTGTNEGLHAAFAGLTTDMSFKMIGSYRFVRKLICDGTYLYVLTPTNFDRIPLSSIKDGSWQATSLVDGAELGVYFDALISDSCALLATSRGLYQSMADVRIGVPAWCTIELPEGQGAVTYLQALSPTGEQGFSYNGNVYALNKQVGSGVTRVYRCAVTQENGSTHVEPIANLFIKDAPSYFLQYNSHRNFAGTDGGFFFSSLVDHKKPTNSNTQEQLFPQLLLNLKPGYRFMEATKTTRPSGVSRSSQARLLTRSSASGTLLLVSELGLTVHE